MPSADKREHDPTPIPRNMKEPPDTVDFDLARVLIRWECVYVYYTDGTLIEDQYGKLLWMEDAQVYVMAVGEGGA